MVSRITAWVLEKVRRKRSRSWWATIILSSFVLGVAIASFIPGQFILPLIIILGVLFLIFLMSASKAKQSSKIASLCSQTFLTVILLSLAFGFGTFCYQLAIPDRGSGSVSSFVGHEVVLEGVVSDEVRRSSKTQGLVLDNLEVDGEFVSQKVLARVPLYPEFQFGDRVRLECNLETPEPFNGFRYDRYLAREGILAICQSYQEPFYLGREDLGLRARLLDTKSKIVERIRLVFHEPYAALLVGLLLCEKNLPDSIEEEFRRVGLSHIIAASGQNVSLVASTLMMMLTMTFLRRKWASVIVLSSILIYVFLAGADAPVIRAGIMGSIIVFSKAVGKIPSTRNLLLLALALMLLQNPLLLRDDVGFQLSFAATTGLVVLQPRLSRFFFFIPRWGGLRESFSTSVAAIAATMPIMLLSFGEVSLIAPIANLIVLPLIPFVMIAGSVILMLSSISYTASLYLAAPVVGGLKLMLGSAHLLSQIPFAAADILHMSWLRVLLFVGSLILLRGLFSLKAILQSDSYQFSLKYFVVSCALLSIFVVPDLFISREFKAHFLSVGQGDSTLLELETGERWLIDGGPDNTVLTKLGQILPWHDRRIDVLVPTHADSDHITGLIEVSRRYDIGQVYLSADDPSLKMRLLQDIWSEPTIVTEPVEVLWLKSVSPSTGSGNNRLVDVEYISKGDDLSRGETEIKVLGPPENLKTEDRNDLSTMLLVTYKESSLLLTGDASKERELEILDNLGHVDILKVGHHGSYTSTSYEFVNKIKPDIAIISSGLGNRYGHPHGIVLERLKEATVLRTDTQGDIRIRLDCEEIKTNYLWY